MKSVQRLTMLFALQAALLPQLSGCGDPGTSDPVDVTPVGPDLRAVLQPIAETGVVGSAGAELQAIAESRPELKNDIDALIAAEGNPAQVKEKAAALLSKI